MRLNFKKISAIASSILLAGMTMGVAAAANYPAPFVSGSSADVAIVYGTGAGVSVTDQTEAYSIQEDLEASFTGTTVSVSGGEGETEDEVPLRDAINFSTSKIETTMDEDNLPSLLKEKISWDDGNGADDYDIYEQIVIGDKMELLTTLDDEDFEGVALTNEMALEYRFVFEDALNCSDIDAAGADDLYLEIMGKSYQVTDITATTITVNIADEYALQIGESVTFDGKVFTVDDIFSDSVQVNGEIINEDATEKIDGVRVKVETVGYHSNSPETSKCILKIGEDISKTYTDGDEYIGEDDDDPLWIWSFSDPTANDGYVGVKFNEKLNDATDEHDPSGTMVKYVGDSYVFPDDFAVVTFEGLTDVDYEDVKVYFDKAELYNLTDSAAAVQDDVDILVIEGKSVDTITVEENSEETDKIAIFWAANGSETLYDGGAFGQLEVFYHDHDGDNTPSGKYRFGGQLNASTGPAKTRDKIASMEIGDSVIDIDLTLEANQLTVTFEDPLDGDIDLNVTGSTAIAHAAGVLDQLGDTAEDADANDVIVNGTDVSTKEADIMNNYGIIAKDVENNADSDEVLLEVPSDQVYGIVSVKAGAEVAGGSTLGNVVIKDTEVSTMSDKNLIIVGGSCINSAAANVLGGAYCGAAFTEATGVGTGQYMVKSFTSPWDATKIALLVAGYEKDDTVAAATYLKTETVDTSGVAEIGTTLTAV